MLLHGVSEPVVLLIVLVLFYSLVETPVVSKTSYSCMLKKGSSLLVVGVEFVSVGFMDQHMSQNEVLAGRYKVIQFKRTDI